jgi:ATP-dependent exoDNAse (exonuclease V) alpha subunit
VAVNGRQLDDNQRFVIKRVATGSDLSIVNYQYGTDRKYVAGLIGKAYQEKGYVVEALSLSGMGAKNFESGSGISSATIFKKLWQWENGQDKLNAKSVIMIDNSNLIGTRQMRQVIEHADQAGAKVILFGQGQSLQAIDAGGAYRGIHAYGAGTAATLMRSEDNTGGWRQRAHDLLLGDTKAAAAAIDLYAEHGRIEKAGDAAAAVVDHWLAAVEQSKSYRNNLMIAYRNDDVQVLNRGARDRLIDRGYVDPSQNIKIRTYDKEALEFASGDRIVFLRKDDDMGIKNGSLGTVRSIAGDNLVIQVDGGQTVSVNVKLYNDLNYGYAASVYKSAGMSVDNTYIWATKHYNKHVVQAALSVHAKEAKIYHEFKDYRQVKETLSRSADKDLAADYPMDAKAYKITVQLREGSWPSQKYVRIEPHINKESEKQELTRQARAFAQQQALQMRLTAEEMKHISIKVKQIPIEKYQEMQKSKAISMDQGLKL